MKKNKPYQPIIEPDIYTKKEYGNALYEASLSRVWKHAKTGFVLLSAFRGDDFEKNMENHSRLKSILKSHKLGYFEIDGQYVYDDGSIESELSVFVPYRQDVYPEFKEFINTLRDIGTIFKQESILVKYPDKEGGSASLVYSNGKEEKIGDKVGYDKISFAYSKLKTGSHKGRSFIIEGVRKPANHINAIQLNAEGMIF